MKHLALLAALSAPLTASAEVLDKEPSAPSLVAAAIAISFLAYHVARLAPRRFALLAPVLVLIFLPTLLEQFEPAVRTALLAEGGIFYAACVWFGPASVLAASAVGFHLRRHAHGRSPLPFAFIFGAVSVAGGFALAQLSGMSAVWATAIVAVAVLANGVLATVEDRNV